MEKTRDELRERGDQALIYRIAGLSGIGKTRFVFEILSPQDLNNQVIYALSSDFFSSDLYYSLQNDPNLSAIVVIDECDLQQHEDIVRAFSTQGSRLAVFTLSYDIGSVSPPSTLLNLGQLSNEKIEAILKEEFSGLPNDITRKLSEFADGYPRIAVLLGESYLGGRGPSEEFLRLSDEALINRLIGGLEDTHSEHFKKTKRVLTGISLFQKVGYASSLSQEAEWVAGLMDIGWQDFQEIVHEQQQRGIIQGQNYLYVTPFMLRVYLLQEWWEASSITQERFIELINSIPEGFRRDLLIRFFDGIPFISATSKGKEFTEAVLGREGIFSDGTLLNTEIGSSFFSD